MHRRIDYPYLSMLETDFLKQNRYNLIAVGQLIDAVLGNSTQFNGLSCVPVSPPAMQVKVLPGEIYIEEEVDPTDYGNLPADTTHTTIKQGLFTDSVTFNCPAPTNPGNSKNYLIQVAFQEVDGDNANRQFYNPALTPPAYNQAVNQFRLDNAIVQLKAGVEATSGTQVTPSPDPGFYALHYVVTTYGQTTITSGNIFNDGTAIILTEKLKDKISQAFADARYAFKSNVPVDKGFFSGYAIANNISNPNTAIDFGSGECRDSAGSALITLISSLTKSITSAWTAGNNQGGLFSGSVAASTTYHLFVILKDSDGSVDAGFDTSVIAANRPPGYTSYRRVASIYTDGSSNIIQFTNEGDEFLLQQAVSNYNVNDPGTAAILINLSVPTGVKLRAILAADTGCLATGGGVYHLLLTSPDQADTVPSVSNFTIKNDIGAAVQLNNTVQYHWRTNTSAQIRIRLDNSTTDVTVYIVTHGWIDDRGRYK